MKKFFEAVVTAIVLMLCQSPAQVEAVDVRLFDSSVENVIANLQRVGNKNDIDIWGKEYYTYQDVNRCELHFGNSKNNTIRFRVNNDNTVARALVTVQASSISTALESSLQGRIMAMTILYAAGMSTSEIDTLYKDAGDKYLDAFGRNPYMTHYHEKTSAWISNIQRYVMWDNEMTDSGSTATIDIYLYAYK